jgi:hypothetical protein
VAKVITTKRLNLAQLGSELGGVGLACRGGDPASTDSKEVEADVAQADLQSAIDAHVYDGFWGDDDARQLDNLRAKAQAVIAGTDSFTAAQLQQIAARTVLYLLRLAGR